MSANNPNADGWRDFHEMPDDVHVLFIEGYCQVPWMQEDFLKCPAIRQGCKPFEGLSTFRAWCTDPSYLGEKDTAPDAFEIQSCIREIESGKYHAIVVVDYSCDLDSEPTLEQSLGRHLQEFVRAGGVVAFPSSESMLVTALTNLFDVPWKRSDYYRTTWGPCQENEANVNYSFGNGSLARRVINPYSAKGNTIRSVPAHERCFGVTDESRTQSLVPMMSGRDVSKKDDDDYDVIVALHNYGKGAVAYFGDVNGEGATIWLVSAFVESRSPRLPIDCFSGLQEPEFTVIMAKKAEGNGAFQKGQLDGAESLYNQALQIYGSKLGSNGDQRDVHVSLLSNLALVYLKKKEYLKAETAATKALDIEWGHGKSSYRRAMARLQVSLNTTGGDLSRLRGARKDILNVDICDSTRKLMERINAQMKRVEKRHRENFGAGFAAAMSGTLS